MRLRCWRKYALGLSYAFTFSNSHTFVFLLMGKKPWEVAHLDTMEMWKFGDYKHYTSLDLMAAIFGIPTSKDGIDGSQVNEVYYKENNLEKIKKYCVSDVIVMVQLYLRLRSLRILETENIITA